MPWHGWLPALDGSGLGAGWALGPGRFASSLLEVSLSAYTSRVLEDWVSSDDCSAVVRSLPLICTDVWTDGSTVRDEVTGVCCAGSGVYALASGSDWFDGTWAHLDLLPPEDQNCSAG